MASCSCCNAPTANSRCGGCKQVYYCNAICQRKHWKIHKKKCSFKQIRKKKRKKVKKIPKANSYLKNADTKGLYQLGKQIKNNYNSLTFGYIRSETHRAAPSAIVQIIQNKYLLNDVIEWKIDIDKFIEKGGADMPTFQDKGCNVKVWADLDMVKCVSMCIKTEHESDDIIGSDVYMEIICDELNIGTKLTRKQDHDYSFIFMTMEKTEFMRQKTITFRVHLEVLAVFYKNSSCEYFRKIKLSSHLKYEWKIVANVLKAMKIAEFEPFRNMVDAQNKNLFFSPNFGFRNESQPLESGIASPPKAKKVKIETACNDYVSIDNRNMGWYLEYHPKTVFEDMWSQTGPMMGSLTIKPLYMPPGIGKICIKCKLSNDCDGAFNHENCDKYLTYGFNCGQSCTNMDFSFEKLKAVHSLTFFCEITIASIYDLDDSVIAENEWIQYGVY